MKHEKIISLVGNTPVVLIENYRGARLWAKLEGHNPTGSLKDRTASAAVLNTDPQDSEKVLLDGTSGSYGCGLSYHGRIHGRRVTIVVNEKISNENETFLRIQGAEIIRYGKNTGESRSKCLEMVDKDPTKWQFTDQLTNPLFPKVHEETTGVEITSDLPNVSAIVGSKGTGATLCGISRHAQAFNPNIRVFGSGGFPGDVGMIAGTHVDGVDFDSPFHRELAGAPNYVADVLVTYDEAMGACQNLPVLVGPQGGGVYKATLRAVEEYDIAGDVVMIMGDTMLKNVSRF